MAKEQKSFEKSLERIDEIISTLENKGVSLEDSVTLYEEAVHLVKDCHTILEKVEGKVRKIINKEKKEVVDLDV